MLLEKNLAVSTIDSLYAILDQTLTQKWIKNTYLSNLEMININYLYWI
jgi:hypothetical protein